MGKFRGDRVGEKFVNNQGCEGEIVEWFGIFNCTIKFKENILIYNVQYANISKKMVKNPYHPSIHGVGYLGIGKYKPSINGVRTEVYKMFRNMFKKCYSNHNNKSCYIGIEVCKEWHNFQNFGAWYEHNWKPWMDGSWELDKDILSGDIKIYSAHTCAIVPREINNIFKRVPKRLIELPTGVMKIKSGKFTSRLNSKQLGTLDSVEKASQLYQESRDLYLKNIAKKWENKVDTRVYYRLYNYYDELS